MDDTIGREIYAMRNLAEWKAEQNCKCCGGRAKLYGVVDFSKNCSERQGIVLPISGIPVYYYRCSNCGFIFTTYIDDFTYADLERHIYNDEYIQVDPGWAETRPRAEADIVIRNFSQYSETLSILDYGCGNGRLSEILSENGFHNVHNFDPLVEEFSALPEGRFDLVLCFEVFEHLPDPREACHNIVQFLTNDGVVLHSTLLQPRGIEKIKLNWWYVCPRNGHVSIFSAKSLAILWREVGLSVASATQDIHIAFRKIPEFATHILKPSGRAGLN